MPLPWLYNPSPAKALAACPSPWQIKPQTEGKQYPAPGVSAGLITQRFVPVPHPFPLCGQIRTLEQQADTCELDKGVGSFKEGFPGHKGTCLPCPRGQLRALPHRPQFQYQGGAASWGVVRVTRVQTCWRHGGSEAWENWWATDSQDFKNTIYHHLSSFFLGKHDKPLLGGIVLIITLFILAFLFRECILLLLKRKIP